MIPSVHFNLNWPLIPHFPPASSPRTAQHLLTLSLFASSSWIRPPNLLLHLHAAEAAAEAHPALLQHQHQLLSAGHRVSTSAGSGAQASWGSSHGGGVSDQLCRVAVGTGVCRNGAG